MMDSTAKRCSRRQALLTGSRLIMAAGVTGTPFVRGQAQNDKKSVKTGWIDAHSHIWSRDVARFPLAAGQTVDDLSPPSFDHDELLQTAAAEKVQRVVLIQHHTYHSWSNDYLTWAAEQHPDRFRVVGMVDDLSAQPAQQMRDLLQKRVTGIRITPRIRGTKWLEGAGMQAMWQCAAATGQAMCCLIDAQDLEAVEKMCRRHPDTPVVIDHFARIGVDGQIRDRDVKQLCRLARHKHTYVKLSAYYALGKKQPPYLDLVPMIRTVLDAYGPQRCMWASDSPYQLIGEHTYAASIALIRDRIDWLSESDKEHLLRTTAEKVYFKI